MKKVLLIWEPFYEYPKKITDSIRSLGYEVELFTIINDDITDIQHRHNAIRFRKHHEKVMERNYSIQREFYEQHRNTPYDKIIMCVSFGLEMEAFKSFISAQNGEKIMYLWDTLLGCPDCDNLRPFFDKIVSFDFEDCQKYGFVFLPTFYTDEYIYGNECKNIDFSIFGALHTDREYVLGRILEQFPIDDYVWRASLITERTPYVLKLIKRKVKKPFYVDFKGKPPEIIAEVIKHSKVCIDICRPGQSGLTLRTYESMAAHAKLITTNDNVKRMDFYNENNICVIDRKNPTIDKSFVSTPYKESQDIIVRKYSVNAWVKKLISI